MAASAVGSKKKAMAADGRAAAVSELELTMLDADEMARVQALVNESSTQKEPKKRQPMQDFTAFALYLNESIWQMYKSGMDSLQLLEIVVNWLAEKFLLQCPSEPTSACLAAFTIRRDSEESRQRALLAPDVLLATTKAQVSSVLARHKFVKVPEDKYVKKLPLDPSKLPEHLQDIVRFNTPPGVKLLEVIRSADGGPDDTTASSRQGRENIDERQQWC